MIHFFLFNLNKEKLAIIFYFLLITISFCQTENIIQQEREHLILNARKSYAEEKIVAGKEAFANQKYLLAFECYKEALDALAKPKLELTSLHQESLYSLNQAAVVLILEYTSLGEYENAKNIILVINDRKYYFNYPPSVFLIKKFYNLNIKKDNNLYAKKSEEVKNILSLAINYYRLGEWTIAVKKYKEVLQTDPENIAAQLGMELINQEQREHVNFVADQYQNNMIDAIDKSWELPSPSYECNSNLAINEPAMPIKMGGTHAIIHKIRNIRIPQIEFFETPLRSALDLLKRKAFLLDTGENDSNKKGVNIILALDIKKITPEPKITLTLHDAPLEEAIKYVVEQAHLKMKIEPYAVAIIPEDESNEVLFTKEYNVSSSFISSFSNLSHLTHSLSENNVVKKVENLSIKDILISLGITFPTGATAHYIASSNILIVKNNQENLDLIDSLVESSFSTPLNQVQIEARFLEIKQNNTKEKGLDWLLGAFQFCNINTGGGTVANQANYQPSDYPIQNNGIPVGSITSGPPGAGSVTSGNRTGTAAINANALETLLFGNPTGPAAGVLALAGVLTNPQFQVVLRAINQHKGTDLLSAPKITVSSGKKASITIAREFPYPADYSPPQVPQNQGTSVNPAIPTTPSSFKKRDVGVHLEVAPIINPSDNTVELSLSPQVVEFQGFVNYGSPIFSQAPVFLGVGQTNIITSTAQVLLTENIINQPIFSVRQVDAQVILRDGQTVVLGGLMREDIQKEEDKIPIIGNIPIAGSLFRSSSEQKIKRNLLIFVTVHFLDPSGQVNHKAHKNYF